MVTTRTANVHVELDMATGCRLGVSVDVIASRDGAVVTGTVYDREHRPPKRIGAYRREYDRRGEVVVDTVTGSKAVAFAASTLAEHDTKLALEIMECARKNGTGKRNRRSGT